MKVLLLNDYGTPAGGAEFQILAVRDGLRARGHDARLFASRARTSPSAAASVAEYDCYGTNSRLQPLSMTLNPSAFRRLRRALAEFRPDVVHVQMFMWQLSPLILPLLRDVPSIHHVQMYNAVCPVGTKLLPDGKSCRQRAGAACYRGGCLSARAWPALMFQRKLWRRWGGAFDRVVAASEAVGRRLAADGVEVSEVICNGVPAGPCANDELARAPTVVYAGRLSREKGVDVLVRAFKKVTTEVAGARLLIAGEGAERDMLERLISELDLSSRVSLLGYVAREELGRAFAGAWAQAVPGRWEEPFGMVTAEASMRGTAVVATAAGASVEIVEDGRTGLLVPAGDECALARALARLLRDPELARRMGRAGREVALEKFSEQISVDKFVRLYETLLERRRKGTTSDNKNQDDERYDER